MPAKVAGQLERGPPVAYAVALENYGVTRPQKK